MALGVYPAYKAQDVQITISEECIAVADVQISVFQIIPPNGYVISWQVLINPANNKYFAYVLYVLNVDTSPQKVDVINNSYLKKVA